MKLIRDGLFFLISLAMLVISVCPAVGHEEISMALNDQVARMKANPPYTGPELWGKVMTLIGRKDGFITASDVDAVMGMKLERFKDFPDGGHSDYFPRYPVSFSYMYKVSKPSAGKDGAASAASTFRVDWPFMSDDKKEQCVRADVAFGDVVKSGWEVHHEKPDGITEFADPNHITFVKKGAHIALAYTGTYNQSKYRESVKPEDGCITFIQIDGNLEK
ncbi:hypothetical protein HDE76_000552 [Rhodanobacter sp. ANJX3]|uniref:hypothetical protein n=1 Tax=Rhodanobacter sp. ANJX3 TaxID=2723083 RepID=UPI001619CCE2|nr:hypothetical protein [Rhodanobacter sp. ANJX3]MBB5357370.1 hypothetical protein [Rhodanobacter sp. ANJX3]